MLISLLLLACGSPAPSTPTPTTPAPTTGAAADDTFANVAPAKVLEVVDCADRALARVQEAQWVFWVSLPKQPLQVGDPLLLGKGPLQKAVTCGETTYNDVVVIEQAKVVTAEQAQAALGLKPPEGGLSIAEVVAKRAELAGKPVKVRGRVVKLNKGIFGKNWMHIVDGSQAEGTSRSPATPSPRSGRSSSPLRPSRLIRTSGSATSTARSWRTPRSPSSDPRLCLAGLWPMMDGPTDMEVWCALS
ncbi:MAG: hypothetical protein IPI35_00720 [Deltaproteobacteria bacterium]|nr:hypothetical protein [Deltaproteobacteria bacterium]